MITKDFALLCEFASLSVNHLHTFGHVFDRTTFADGAKPGLQGFLAVKLVGLPGECEVEAYLTDAQQTLVPNAQLFKGKVKGPQATIVVRVPGLAVPDFGEYTFWARVDGGEPMRLTTWTAVQKS
jgi:hypothetical protein